MQVIYNIFDQNPEDQLFPACREHDVAVIARVPFDEGTLTGNLTKDSTWPEETAQRLLRAGEPWPQRRAGRTPEAHRRGRRADHAGDGAAVHPVQPRRQHHHSGDAQVRNVEANIAASDAGPLPDALHAQLRPFRWDRQPTEWSQ